MIDDEIRWVEMRRWQGWILNKGGRPAQNLLAISTPGLKSGATNISSLRDGEFEVLGVWSTWSALSLEYLEFIDFYSLFNIIWAKTMKGFIAV